MAQVLRFAAHALGRPYHAARVRFAPRTRDSELHAHADFYEFMGVVSGEGEHLLPTGPRPLLAGDVVLVRPRDQHALRGIGPDGLEFVNVAFPRSAWQGFLTLTRADAARGWDAAREPVTLRPDDAAAAIAVFETVLDRFGDDPDHFDLVRFWIDLLSLIPAGGPGSGAFGNEKGSGSSRNGSVDGPRHPYGAAPSWLADACAAMRAEENLRGGVPRLLELAGVSPAHLSRAFRAAYATTPTAFVADLRLEHAASLLAATTEPIAAIAARCGYSSQSYFTRCFTAAHQLSPRAFRHHAQRAFVP